MAHQLINTILVGASILFGSGFILFRLRDSMTPGHILSPFENLAFAFIMCAPVSYGFFLLAQIWGPK